MTKQTYNLLWCIAAYCVAAAFVSSTATKGQSLDGSPFVANSDTDNSQYGVDVDISPGGDYTLVWHDVVADVFQGEANAGVLLQRYDGGMTNNEKISDTVSGDQVRPSIAYRDDGSSIVVWNSMERYKAGPDNQMWIKMARFDSQGSKIGNAVTVACIDDPEPTTCTPVGLAQSHARVGIAPGSGLNAGRFVVVWTEIIPNNGAARGDIYARRFESDGTPLGSSFRVNTTTAQAQERADVRVFEDGSFVVVWDSYLGDAGPDFRDIVARAYDANGNPGSEITVATNASASQCCARIGSVSGLGPAPGAAAWQFVIVWDEEDPTTLQRSVQARYFDSTATGATSQFQVSPANGSLHHGYPAVSKNNPSSSAVVVWEEHTGTGEDRDIIGRVITPSGPAGGEFCVADSTFDEERPEIARAGDEVVVAYRSWRDPDGLNGTQYFDAYGQKIDLSSAGSSCN